MTITLDNPPQIERMLSTTPDNEKQLRAIITKVLSNAVKELQQQVRSGMNTDPHQTYRAVRRMVYKSVLGGNINILDPRRSRSGSTGSRTDQYFGADRAFILRFLNSGTQERTTKKGYRRGSISARGLFSQPAPGVLKRAAELIEQETAEYLAKALEHG